MPTEKSLQNLRPVQPGEIRNPRGVNQFSYRAEAERLLDEMLCEVKDGRCRAEAVIDRVLELAEQGKPWAARLIFERALPATQKHEHARPDAPTSVAELLRKLDQLRSHRFTPTEEEQRQLKAELGDDGGVH